MPAVLAADLGGSHLRAAMVAAGGQLVRRAEFRLDPGLTGTAIADAVAANLAAIAGSAGEAPVAACVAVAGLVDADRGRVIFAPNIPGFRDLDLVSPLAARLGVTCAIENDATAAALGELRFGAARGLRHLLHATLGTGIGGGIVVDGRIYRGAAGLAGEIGHVVVDPAGPLCNCGTRGCLEAIVSGTAFAERARRLLAGGRPTLLAELTAGRAPTSADLFEAARLGDALAEAEIRHGGHVLGLALGGLVNVLNPDAVSLSGGLLAMGELLLEPLRGAMASIAYGPAAATPVLLSDLGGDGGLLGAAAIAFDLAGVT